MIIGGIDYSLSCPAITVLDDNSLICMCRYFTGQKKAITSYVSPFYSLYGDLQSKYDGDQERYEMISNWAFNIVKDCDVVALEGYSFGSHGRVFNIAENTQALKYKLWKAGIRFDVVPPTAVKKFATGKGNAKKEAMVEFFEKQNSIDLTKIFNVKKDKVGSPASDVADSFFLVKYSEEIGI